MSNRIDTDEQLELLARVAEMYYVQAMNQSQIASKTGYSRSMISRLLTQAVKQKIVEFHIYHPLARCTNLERDLQRHFGLKDVRVLSRGTLDYQQMLSKLGKLAARLMDEMLCVPSSSGNGLNGLNGLNTIGGTHGSTLGVSWGTAVAATINSLKPKPCTSMNVVQIIGSYGTPDPEVDGHELARKLARVLGGKYAILPAPLVVASEIMRNALLNDQRVKQILASTRTMSMALIGIGNMDDRMDSMVRAGYINKSNLRELSSQGAVGNVCAIYFDANGHPLDVPLSRRIVGIDARSLQAVPYKLGVAGGQEKAQAILGALRGKFVNTLVTDEAAAVEILRLQQVSS